MTTNSSNDAEVTNYNVTLIGDGYVGKSSILKAIENLREKKKVSIQKETTANLHGELEVELEFRNQKIKFCLVDTAGQEEYDQIRKPTYDQTSVFLLCFSVADRTSFENVQARWVPEIHRHRHVPVVLVGTKTDLERRAVSRDRGQKLRRKIGAAHYVECSAATGDGIDVVVECCAQILAAPEKKKRTRCAIQ